MAAGTDYAIFLLGRYQEARQAGEDRMAAYFTMYRSTAHVIIGSGLTVAAAIFCLGSPDAVLPEPWHPGRHRRAGHPGRLPHPGARGHHDGQHHRAVRPQARDAHPRLAPHRHRGGPLARADPGGLDRGRADRTARPAGLQDLLRRPRPYQPDWAPAKVGYAAAERHSPPPGSTPGADGRIRRDLRTPANMKVLENVAKAVFRTPGVAMVQSITRPLGTPLDHTSLGFAMSAQSSAQLQSLPFQQARAADLARQVAEISKAIDLLRQQYGLQQQRYDLQQQATAATDEQVKAFAETSATIKDLRDKVAYVDDFFRPIKNYFCWEPHCFDIPICQTFRSLFDALDGVNNLTDQFDAVTKSLDKLNALQPQLLALIPQQLELVEQQIQSQETNKDLAQANYATQTGLFAQQQKALENSDAMGKAFDDSKDDSTFYLPGCSTTPSSNAAGTVPFTGRPRRPDDHHPRRRSGDHPRHLPHRPDPPVRAGGAQGTRWRARGSHRRHRVGLQGRPRHGQQRPHHGGHRGDQPDPADHGLRDPQRGGGAGDRRHRGAVAGRLVRPLGADLAHLLGIQLYWIVLALAVIILLAVGSDYNLLVISRFKEEIGAGLNTGLIRTMAGTGSVVTAAGLVFAFTMCGFAFGDLMVLAQIGTTIGVGLIFDTLIVRSFMTPSIAALLGRWFWWPLTVRPRPPAPCCGYGTRPSVHALLDAQDR